MKIGVTGARGFIGGAVKDYMISQGYDVLDYGCNLSSPAQIDLMLSTLGPPNILVHLAGRFAGTYEELHRDNLVSTHNLLQALEKYPEVHFVFGSSGAVYGNTGEKPIIEVNDYNPNTVYGLVKYFCEETIIYHQRLYNNKITLLRFPSVYGENNFKGIIYNWINGALKEQKIVIHGDGSQRRCFIKIDDICDAIHKVIANGIHGTFNLSHPESFSLNCLATFFKETFDIKILHEQANNNLESMVLDSRKFQLTANWVPKSDIKEFIQSYRDN